MELREQVTSQAPKGAIGYRLVLPGRFADETLRLSPKRSRARDVAWYSLAPFEYPDDIRLRDSCWYRILWIDAQGQRIRKPATEPSSALYFFLGPPYVTVPPMAERAWTPQSSEAAKQPPPAEETALPPQTVPTQQETAPTTVTASSLAVTNAQPLAQADIISVSSGTTPQTVSTPSARAASDDGITAETEAAFLRLLDSYPPIPSEHWPLIYAFVMQVPWMIWLISEHRRRDALEHGQPPPQMPILNLSAKENAAIERLLRTAPPHFIPLCKQLFEFLHQHGTEVLELAPTPFFPMEDEQQKQILRALRDSNSKAYLEYIYRFHEAQLHQQKLPEEPAVKLSSNQRRELKKLLFDLRAVSFFKRHALSSA